MDSYAASNLLHRHPAHGDICGHGVDFVDDTAGKRFNVVHGNQSLPVGWLPIYQWVAALRRDQRVASRLSRRLSLAYLLLTSTNMWWIGLAGALFTLAVP